jgi:flagellar basal body-associated protein FliL
MRVLLATIGAVALVAGIAFVTQFAIKNQQAKTAEKAPSSQPAKQPEAQAPQLNEQQIATQQKIVDDFEAISKEFNAKNYQKTVTLAVVYGSNSANDTTLRLSAYDYCIRSAVILQNDADKTVCLQKGTELAATLQEDEAKQTWTKQFANAQQNKVEVGEPTNGQIGAR